MSRISIQIANEVKRMPFGLRKKKRALELIRALQIHLLFAGLLAVTAAGSYAMYADIFFE